MWQQIIVSITASVCWHILKEFLTLLSLFMCALQRLLLRTKGPTCGGSRRQSCPDSWWCRGQWQPVPRYDHWWEHCQTKHTCSIPAGTWWVRKSFRPVLFYISINITHFRTLTTISPFPCIPGWWSDDLFRDKLCRGLSFPFLSMFPPWHRSHSSSLHGHCGRNDAHPQLHSLPHSINIISSHPVSRE